MSRAGGLIPLAAASGMLMLPSVALAGTPINFTWIGPADGNPCVGTNTYSNGIYWDPPLSCPVNGPGLAASIFVNPGAEIDVDCVGDIDFLTVGNGTLTRPILYFCPGSDLTVNLAANIDGIISGKGGHFTAPNITFGNRTGVD